MKEDIRIKNKLEFEDILTTGKKIKNDFFIIYYKDRKKEFSRFGITLVKKFGNAVKRNKYKRIIREIVRTNQNIFKKDNDYIIIVKKTCENANYNILKNSLVDLLK